MAGIALLRKLILKDLLKKSGSGKGITSLKNLPILKVDAETELAKYLKAAERQGVNLDEFSEQKIKYVWELNKPKGPTIGGHRVIDATSPEGKGITESLLGKKGEVVDMTGKKIDPNKPIIGGKQLTEAEQDLKIIQDSMDDLSRVEREADAFSAGENMVSEIIALIKSKKPIDAMKEANSVIGRKGKYKKLTSEQSKKILKDTEDHIFQRDIKYDEFGDPIKPDPEDFAGGGRASSGLNYLLGEDDQNVRVPVNQGGRIAFGLGGFNAARRAFLKLLGVGAATGVAAKSGLFSLLKAGKPTAQVLTSVPIKDISGMPAWFKPLVNRVIKDGNDVTKTHASKDMELVHKTVLPDSNTDVIVTQSLDTGDVVVDIGVTKHGFAAGHLGQPTRLVYKAEEVIEPTISKSGKVTKQGTKTKDEFWVEEAEFTGGHPENIKFEEATIEKFGAHGSNFDEVEKFATGKIKKKTGKASIKAERAHWTPEGDYASGGRVPMWLGGGLGAGKSFIRALVKNLAKDKGMTGSEIMKVLNPKAYQKFLDDPANVHKWDPKTGIFGTEKAKELMKSTKGARVEQLEGYLGMAKSSKEGDENIKKLIDAAVETGMSRESAERMAKGLREGIDIEDLIPKGVTDEVILDSGNNA